MIKDYLVKYLNKELSAIELIRILTGIFNPDHAISILALANQVCRHELGDLDTETFKKVYEIE